MARSGRGHVEELEDPGAGDVDDHVDGVESSCVEMSDDGLEPLPLLENTEVPVAQEDHPGVKGRVVGEPDEVLGVLRDDDKRLLEGVADDGVVGRSAHAHVRDVLGAAAEVVETRDVGGRHVLVDEELEVRHGSSADDTYRFDALRTPRWAPELIEKLSKLDVLTGQARIVLDKLVDARTARKLPAHVLDGDAGALEHRDPVLDRRIAVDSGDAAGKEREALGDLVLEGRRVELHRSVPSVEPHGVARALPRWGARRRSVRQQGIELASQGGRKLEPTKEVRDDREVQRGGLWEEDVLLRTAGPNNPALYFALDEGRLDAGDGRSFPQGEQLLFLHKTRSRVHPIFSSTVTNGKDRRSR